MHERMTEERCANDRGGKVLVMHFKLSENNSCTKITEMPWSQTDNGGRERGWDASSASGGVFHQEDEGALPYTEDWGYEGFRDDHPPSAEFPWERFKSLHQVNLPLHSCSILSWARVLWKLHVWRLFCLFYKTIKYHQQFTSYELWINIKYLCKLINNGIWFQVIFEK